MLNKETFEKLQENQTKFINGFNLLMNAFTVIAPDIKGIAEGKNTRVTVDMMYRFQKFIEEFEPLVEQEIIVALKNLLESMEEIDI